LRLKKRYTENIAKYVVFWEKSCLVQNTLRLFTNLLLKPYLSLYALYMKESNKWKKPRLTSWFITTSFFEWRRMKILKPCIQGFKLLYLAFKFLIKAILFLIMSRRFLGVCLIGSNQRLQPFRMQRIWTQQIWIIW